jgi:thiamine pyrophosphate-dependent acetolactate synthase large subunit-like protein
MLEQFVADGFRFMFGNPGTVEQGLLDALEGFRGGELRYVLCLQESVAVAVADGYARAARRPALVQLHAGVGLGNGIGMLYQALRGHSPLVVIAGDAGVRYDAMDAQMAADLVAMARPVTKWAARVTDPDSLLRVLRRAVKIAVTPPAGPVFVNVPMDILDAPNTEEVAPASIPDTRVAPDEGRIREAAEMLRGAATPVIFMGDGVAASGAQAELAHLAELLGAEVWGVDSSEVNIAADHPLFCGLTGHMFGEQSRPISVKADAVLVCGTYLYPEVFPRLSGVFAPGARVVHIDLNTYEIAKNFPVTLGLLGDPKRSLAMLADAVAAGQTDGDRRAARERARRIGEANGAARQKALSSDREVRDAVPLQFSRVAEELARVLPEDALVFDEALTHSPELTRHLVPNRAGGYFQTRGGSLGVGIPGATGLKLAHPERAVVGFTGDGGAMYTIQALWTAAHIRQTMPGVRMDPKFVVCNNRSYRILKLNIMQYWKERELPAHEFPGSFELDKPDLRFDEIARSMGVEAERVEKPEQVGPAVRRALEHPGPYLIDAVVSGDVPGALVGCKCGQ